MSCPEFPCRAQLLLVLGLSLSHGEPPDFQQEEGQLH